MRGIDELDHYELLEVSRSATVEEVGHAYRLSQQIYGEGSLALYSVFESHDAAAIRERLDEAYRVLSDSDLRTRYDENQSFGEDATTEMAPPLGLGNKEFDLATATDLSDATSARCQ